MIECLDIKNFRNLSSVNLNFFHISQSRVGRRCRAAFFICAVLPDINTVRAVSWAKALATFLIAPLVALAQAPTGAPQNRPEAAAIQITSADKNFLLERANTCRAEITKLKTQLRSNSFSLALLPDVEVFHKAAYWPVAYNEFYRSNDVLIAKKLLEQGMERAKALREGSPSWVKATGLVVRAYVSRIDNSIQPYGLVVPASFNPSAKRKHRLDVWLHGRDNILTELKFINDRQRSYGEFTPPDTIVLHPYGRFCNAFKFAGEVDVFEAIDHVRKNYPIDDLRISIRGFSMGGAGTWHLAAHHPGFWAAAAPGAGFAETAEYTGILQREPKPPWYEQTLWRLYDATPYAANFHNCPVIAYSGELDKQRQAAEAMARALAREGLKLAHLIGPKTEHKYEPSTKAVLDRAFNEIVAKSTNPLPDRVRFTTYTLRYNSNNWIRLDGLDHHWQPAEVDAERLPALGMIRIKTKNVSALTLVAPSPERQPYHLANGTLLDLAIDDVLLGGREVFANNSAAVHLAKTVKGWKLAEPDRELRKRHGLQGPIDDAFLDAFIMVRPTGTAMNRQIGIWAEQELRHATNEWRAQFRGEPIVKADNEVSEADIASCNLILWGDPLSNRLLGRISERLPFTWDRENVRFGGRSLSSSQFVPVLIFPNPLNPNRYVVVNSGFTFCEAAKSSNALQVPKLPDFAVLDMTAPISSRFPQGVALAGFFDERWRIAL